MDESHATSQQPSGPDPISECDVFMTAHEAYPAFERVCLSAKTSIRGSFRVFDLTTRLRSDEARAVGDTWFDLFLDRLNAGVDIDMVVSDFDPIVATEDHRRSWASGRQLAALSELSGAGRLTFRIALHPARVGWVPRIALRGRVRSELEDRDGDPLTPRLNALDADGDLPLVPATHHQKLAVIDGSALYIGGLDLNERRFDTPNHDQPTEETWQDIQAIVRGPVVAAAEAHLETFLSSCDGDQPPPRQPGFLRTLSSRRAVDLVHIAPKSVLTEIEQAHLDAIGRADGLVYLETQFFRHRPIAEALAEAARRSERLACILILPAAPEDVAFEGNDREDAQLGAQKQMEALDILHDGLGPRVAVAAPVQPDRVLPDDDPASLHRAPLIYVHSKLSIFGGREAILSSANLNGRSMKWDTEAGIHITQPQHVARLWSRVRDHWLGDHAPDWNGDAPALVAEFNRVLAKNVARGPGDRDHFLLPYDRSRDAELAAPVFGMPDEMV